MQFRCHVGHAYSAEFLRDAQSGTVESSLWTALRALKESAALDERLAERTRAHGLDAAADVYARNAGEKHAHAAQVQAFLRQLRPAS